MNLKESESIILKSYNLSEADKIVIFLTRQHGIVRGVAKGAKRLKSRFGGSLEPFTVVNLSYRQKEERELVSINQIDLLKSYFGIASEPLFLQKFSYLTELLIDFSPPHDPNENLYRMIKVCLDSASADYETLNIITFYFELWLLRLGGYLPDWTKCGICGQEITGDRAGLQNDFHLICAACQKAKSSVQINRAGRELFQQAQKTTPENFLKIAADRQDEIKQISAVFKRIISSILGREVTGEKVLLAAS